MMNTEKTPMDALAKLTIENAERLIDFGVEKTRLDKQHTTYTIESNAEMEAETRHLMEENSERMNTYLFALKDSGIITDGDMIKLKHYFYIFGEFTYNLERRIDAYEEQ